MFRITVEVVSASFFLGKHSRKSPSILLNPMRKETSPSLKDI
jgi:hypothetical protein